MKLIESLKKLVIISNIEIAIGNKEGSQWEVFKKIRYFGGKCISKLSHQLNILYY